AVFVRTRLIWGTFKIYISDVGTLFSIQSPDYVRAIVSARKQPWQNRSQRQQDPLHRVFAAQIDQLVIESRSRLGGLFRAEDYPTSKEIRDKFGFDNKVMPLPDADDFRVSLGDEERDRTASYIVATAPGRRWSAMPRPTR